MEKLISSWYNGQTLPESYIFPLDARSGNLTTAPSRDNIPVIDLGGAKGGDQTYVVNHGISESLLNDTMGVFKEFFDLHAEDKANLYFDDPKKSCMLSTSSGYFDLEDVHLWRDYLRHPCHPLEEYHVNGLQVFKNGEWINVEPISQALVVNIGHQLQIISNGKLKSVEHWAVTSSSHSRTSTAFFIAPSDDCIVEPAEALISASNPQHYKPFQYKEFFINYVMKQGKTEVLLETFKLQA
ncbi:hypothetical protein ACFX16_004334 [Malus domestica]